MAMQAWEVKNLFIHTLRNFTVEELDKLWQEFIREVGTDEHAFVDWLELLMPERFD